MNPGARIAFTAALLVLTVTAANAQVSKEGGTVAASPRGNAKPDYANAKPMRLPLSNLPALPQSSLLEEGAAAKVSGAPGVERGSEGNGKKNPVTLPVNKALADEAADAVTPQEYGAGGQPYTTSVGLRPADPYFRRAGKLFFKDGASSFVCTASLIKRGLVVTAAHCVSKFGERRFYNSFQFVPAYDQGAAPYGVWNWASARVPTSYYDGTDSCAVSGVVCANDVAVIVLAPQSGRYAGAATGWFGYGVNGYSYVNGQASITQIGYPVALNGGSQMILTNSQGGVSSSNSNNTIIGSLQTGGSSGGPWIVNFGHTPTLTAPTGFGSAPNRNIVVGTTSWGYTDTSSSGRKQQGAAPFTTNNITALVNAVCAQFPAACS